MTKLNLTRSLQTKKELVLKTTTQESIFEDSILVRTTTNSWYSNPTSEDLEGILNMKKLIPRTEMVVCSTCGYERCPKATDGLDCTGSNAPDQPGPAYTNTNRELLRHVQIGARIRNIVGRGVKIVGECKLMAREGNYVQINLPSNEIRMIHQNCTAEVIEVGGVEDEILTYEEQLMNSMDVLCPEHPKEKLLKEENGPDEKTGFCLRCCKHYKLDSKSIK